jgi:antitoxin component of MazEF toxin-antitoxin module
MLTVLWVSLPATVLAKERCRISVDTILASRQGSGVDARLKRHVGELQNMFNYTSYQLLNSKTLNLKKGESGTVSLPGNRRLRITPHNIRENRADIALQMMKQRRTVFQSQIQLLNRGSLFVGGPEYENGNLIFKISGSY